MNAWDHPLWNRRWQYPRVTCWRCSRSWQPQTEYCSEVCAKCGRKYAKWAGPPAGAEYYAWIRTYPLPQNRLEWAEVRDQSLEKYPLTKAGEPWRGIVKRIADKLK